ncbi:PAS domain-containing protein [Neisseria arctica]|nr:PAS domain-containing protein [Neisseria arctica]UOO86830.1 PAS domain-containing protein [Neisseria arctica]
MMVSIHDEKLKVPYPGGSEVVEHIQQYHDDPGERIIYTTDKEHMFPEGALIVSRTDSNGIITHANDVFVEISGWSREELIGAPHSILRHPDMPQAAFADLWATIRRGEPWVGYVKNLCKDGGFYWVYASVLPNIRKGKLLGYSSIRRKPCRDKIRELEPVYAAMLAEEKSHA